MSDLIKSFQLYAVCTDCERMERVSIQHMIEAHGPDLTIDSIRCRLRCRQCRQRTGDIRIVYVGEQAKLSGFHYRGNTPRTPLSPRSPRSPTSTDPAESIQAESTNVRNHQT